MTRIDSQPNFPFPADVSRRWQGFTRVELLVVVSIIVLLIAILLPTLGAARNAARGVNCLSNTRPISIALHTYAADYNDTLPYYAVWQGTDESTYWYAIRMPYLNQQFLPGRVNQVDGYVCPAREEQVFGTGPGGLEALDYGVNYAAGEGLFQYYHWNNDPTRHGSVSLVEVISPSTIFGLMDSQPTDFSDSPGSFRGIPNIYAPYTRQSPTGTVGWSLDTDYDGDGIDDSASSLLVAAPCNFAAPRHPNASLNAAFVDGHAATVKIVEWVQPKHWVW